MNGGPVQPVGVFAVYMTDGEYANFGIGDIWVGPVDPKPILDRFVAEQSGGMWAAWGEMWRKPRWESDWHPDAGCLLVRKFSDSGLTPAEVELKAAATRAMKQVLDGVGAALAAHGFRVADATELWTG